MASPWGIVTSMVQQAPDAELVPHLPVLDFIACMFTMEAFRQTETRGVAWWRTFLVCFLGYKGTSGWPRGLPQATFPRLAGHCGHPFTVPRC